MGLNKILVKRANELPIQTQKELGIFDDTLIEIRISTKDAPKGVCCRCGKKTDSWRKFCNAHDNRYGKKKLKSETTE